jgi:predicted PhzF superfamily epimerase YddE/YHI9
MRQLHLPSFPSGSTDITPILSFCRTEDTVTYFQYGLPIYSHGKDDRAAFRQVMAQLHVICDASQADIAKAFGVSAISVKRAVKLYRAEGSKGFFAARVTRGAAVLTAPVLTQAQRQLDSGEPPRAVAEALGIKPDTLIKAIRAGRLHAVAKKKQPTAPKAM